MHQTSLQQPFLGWWWRFDHYVISDGLIRPAEGAQLERYSPWEEWGLGSEASGPGRPYMELASLARSLSPRVGPTGLVIGLEPEQEAAITDWCARFGLLGYLLHTTLKVDLAPRWRAVSGDDVNLVARSSVYANATTGWRGWSLLIRSAGAGPDSEEGAPVPQGNLNRNPGVITQDGLLGMNIIGQQLVDAWWPFFPNVEEHEAETFEYPLPLTPPFWDLYAEPVARFIETASIFVGILDGLQGMDIEAMGMGIGSPVGDAREMLNRLLSRAHPSLRIDEKGKQDQAWAGTTLISQLALLLLQDIAGPSRLVTCQVCGLPFLTRSYQGMYCSDRHRRTAQKRAQRKSAKEKRNG